MRTDCVRQSGGQDDRGCIIGQIVHSIGNAAAALAHGAE